MKILFLVLLLAGWFGNPIPAHAELFENAYLSFRLPDGWTCHREETEWVCSPPTPGKKKPAIVIMTAKYQGPSDTLAAYVEHLNSLSKSNSTIQAIVLPKQRIIKGIVWIDAMLLNAEIPNFYTRYMATVSSGIAVLYTFTFAKSQYDTYYAGSDFAVANVTLKPQRKETK